MTVYAEYDGCPASRGFRSEIKGQRSLVRHVKKPKNQKTKKKKAKNKNKKPLELVSSHGGGEVVGITGTVTTISY